MAENFAVKTSFIGVDKMSKVFNKMQKGAQSSFRRMAGSLEKLNRKTKKFRQLAGKITAFAGLAGGLYLAQSALTSTIQKGIEFEKTMVSASVKFGDSAARGTEKFKMLENEALRVGLTTELSASQAAEGFKVMARAGFTAEQSLKAVSLMADLATASELELGKATGIMTDTLGAFNLKTKDPFQLEKNITRISDVVLTATETMANFNMDDFYETMKMSAPILKAAGTSIEEFTAVTALLAESGIKGSMGATTLKNAISNLINPSAKMEVQMKRIGINMTDSSGNIIKMSDVLRQLVSGTNKYTQAQKLAALSTIFGKRATAGMLASMEKGGGKLDEFTDKLQNATGNTRKFAKIQRDTSEGSVKGMQSAIESLQLTLFKGLQPSLTDVTEGIRVFSQDVNAYIKENPKFISNLASAAETVMKIVATIIILNGVMTTLNLLMTIFAVVSPFGWIAVAVLGVIALSLILYNHWESFLFLIKEIGRFILQVIFTPIKAYVDAILWIMKKIQSFTGIDLKSSISFGENISDFLGFNKLYASDRQDELASNGKPPSLYSPMQSQVEVFREERTDQSFLTIEDKTGRAKLTGDTKNIKMNTLKTAESY